LKGTMARNRREGVSHIEGWVAERSKGRSEYREWK
jgi:hypothetical protein